MALLSVPSNIFNKHTNMTFFKVQFDIFFICIPISEGEELFVGLLVLVFLLGKASEILCSNMTFICTVLR